MLPAPLLAAADLLESSGKRQYARDFLLGFQFMPACTQKPEGLPPITDVVLDKVGSWLLRQHKSPFVMKTEALGGAALVPLSSASSELDEGLFLVPGRSMLVHHWSGQSSNQ